MIKMGFEFAVGAIAAYEIYTFLKYVITKICDKIVERGRKYMLDNESIFSKDEIERLKYMTNEIKSNCKTRPIGFVSNLDE